MIIGYYACSKCRKDTNHKLDGTKMVCTACERNAKLKLERKKIK